MKPYSELVTAVQRGDSPAFESLVIQFQDMAYLTAYQYLGERQMAEDAAQEAFWEAYGCLPSLRQPEAFPAWLRRIVLKHCDRLTRRQRVTLLSLFEVPEPIANLATPEAMLEQAQQRQIVLNIIAGLPAIYQEVIQLFYLNGRSYTDIVYLLNLPLSTVKKRLYDARHMLKEQLIPMDTYRPSQNDQFSNRINFFIALKQNNLLQIRQLVKQDASLLKAKTEWGVASDGWYWPLGITALHWAASTGNQPLAALLLEANADIDCLDARGATPLQRATHMGHTEMVSWLLSHHASPSHVSHIQLSVLQTAVIRQRSEIVKLLLEHGADSEQKDAQGRTPLDWAVEKGTSAIVRLLGGPNVIVTPQAPSPNHLPVWETGIKAIDLACPLLWGGRNGLFTPRSGIGIDVMLGELIHRMATQHGGKTIQLIVERGAFTEQSRLWQWRNCGVDEHVTLVATRQVDTAVRWQHATRQAIKAVKQTVKESPVLFVVDSAIMSTKSCAALLEELNDLSNVTLLGVGPETVGAEPEALADLDTAVTFDPLRAQEGWWPAIDLLRSYSHQFAHPIHQSVAKTAVRLARRYADLHPIFKNQGMSAFENAFYGEAERLAVIRGRQLHAFLSQPVTVAEPWTGLPSTTVGLSETIDTVQTILNGELDNGVESTVMPLGEWQPAWT